MDYSILLLEDAENDLDEAFIWYENQRIGLGEEFIKYVEIAFDFIKKHPKASERKEINVHRSIMDKFPYGIYYKMDQEHSQIQIIGILHFKRTPNLWKKRLKKQ